MSCNGLELVVALDAVKGFPNDELLVVKMRVVFAVLVRDDAPDVRDTPLDEARLMESFPDDKVLELDEEEEEVDTLEVDVLVILGF